MSPADPIPIETGHEDMIHDAQLDYYGKRLATCSSDRTVKVFDVVDGETQRGAGQTLKGHTGPVWQVAWAHPKYGHILASCSYDGKVLIWKEQQPSAGGWTKVKEHSLHAASVNSVSWAPHELGAMLACASSDGKYTRCELNSASTDDGQWGADVFEAHAIGCNAVSWAPATRPGALLAPGASAPGQPLSTSAASPVKRFASAGCDNLVKIWAYNEETQTWTEEDVLEGHADWVRDVAWAPNIGLPRSYIATASQDKTVLIWTKDSPTAPWVKTALDPTSISPSGTPPTAPGKFPDVVWRVSWSLAGNILAVSCGDGKVTLWKENLKGGWECIPSERSRQSILPRRYIVMPVVVNDIVLGYLVNERALYRQAEKLGRIQPESDFVEAGNDDRYEQCFQYNIQRFDAMMDIGMEILAECDMSRLGARLLPVWISRRDTLLCWAIPDRFHPIDRSDKDTTFLNQFKKAAGLENEGEPTWWTTTRSLIPLPILESNDPPKKWIALSIQNIPDWENTFPEHRPSW
ncbi:hypothetical protein EW146_g9785 [Bondarzewia mesenterica]|uniref:Uncharacterized protein n=1 Tax=Bondarzewia mesenterica TaxID=1095465 RepID=A0A4S4L3J0_9AGAM|nr:hypothetical protein EW146_g9785 [Bondarzewia mesenterica]